MASFFNQPPAENPDDPPPDPPPPTVKTEVYSTIIYGNVTNDGGETAPSGLEQVGKVFNEAGEKSRGTRRSIRRRSITT